ncbi:MAG: hypothetical protein ACPGN3_14110 [Opitutales bacterium]
MKNLVYLFPICILGPFISAQEEPRLISEDEAQSIVEAEVEAKEERDAEKRAQINAVTVLDQNVLDVAPSQIIVRRISAPAINNANEEEVSIGENTKLTESNPEIVESTSIAVFPEQLRPHEMISISATVYKESHTRIYWNNPDDGKRFTVWTNLALLYLSPISSFETESAHYSYFGFSEVVSEEDEKKRGKDAEKLGYEYDSRWFDPPVQLSEEYTEYVIEADTSENVPDKLYEHMDGLLSYYLEHEKQLKIAHINAEKLRDARLEYEKKNPKQPKPTITNFWPGKNSSYTESQ